MITETNNFRITSNTIEYRIERLWLRRGWLCFLTGPIETWEAVNSVGSYVNYDHWDEENSDDIIYYETVEDAQTAIQKFINDAIRTDIDKKIKDLEPKEKKSPMITRLSPWYVIDA